MSLHEYEPRRRTSWAPILTLVAIALIVGGFILMGVQQ